MHTLHPTDEGVEIVSEVELVTEKRSLGEKERSLREILRQCGTRELPSYQEGALPSWWRETPRQWEREPWGKSKLVLGAALPLLQKGWNFLHLDSLRSLVTTPIIAGGWVEQVVCSRLALPHTEYIGLRGAYMMEKARYRDIEVYLCYDHDVDAAESAYLTIEDYLCSDEVQAIRSGEQMAIEQRGVRFVVNTGLTDGGDPGAMDGRIIIHLIPVDGMTPDELISSFDVDCCCSYYMGWDKSERGHSSVSPHLPLPISRPSDGRNGALRALPRALRAWETRVNLFPSHMTSGFEARALQYYLKGYDLVFPSEYYSKVDNAIVLHRDNDSAQSLDWMVSKGEISDFFSVRTRVVIEERAYERVYFGADGPRADDTPLAISHPYFLNACLDLPLHKALAAIQNSLKKVESPPFALFPITQLARVCGGRIANAELREFLSTGKYSDRVLAAVTHRAQSFDFIRSGVIPTFPFELDSDSEEWVSNWAFGDVEEEIASMKKEIRSVAEKAYLKVLEMIDRMVEDAPSLRRLIEDDMIVSYCLFRSIDDWFGKTPSERLDLC